MAEDREKSFLDRWSRRKHAAARGDPLPEPARPVVETPVPAAPSSAPTELPSLDSLEGLASEYKDFLRPEVDPATRSAALKKLFSDPHFNQMDGLDVYIEDYGKLETLPAALLQALNQAQSLGLFNEKEPATAGVTEKPPSADSVARGTEPERLARSPTENPPVEAKPS
jgi:Protein of unknown function (DUF3306)